MTTMPGGRCPSGAIHVSPYDSVIVMCGFLDANEADMLADVFDDLLKLHLRSTRGDRTSAYARFSEALSEALRKHAGLYA